MVSTNNLISSFKKMEKQAGEMRVPIATDMYLPNHSGVASHPEAIQAFGTVTYLGTITGTRSDATDTEIGRISIAAGDFQNGDMLHFIVDGNNSGTAPQITYAVTDGTNSVLLIPTITGANTGNFFHDGWVQSQYNKTNETFCALSALGRFASVNTTQNGLLKFNNMTQSNWITKAWDFYVMLIGDSIPAGTTNVRVRCYKVKGGAV